MNTNSTIDFANTKTAFAHLDSKKLKKTYALFLLMNQNYLVKVGTFFIKKSLAMGIPIKKKIKSTIFEHFCGGESIFDCKNTIDQLFKFKIGTILDYSIEGENSEKVFENTKSEILETILFAKNNPQKIPFTVFKITGVGSVNLLSKVQANEDLLSNEEKIEFDKIKSRVTEICALAAQNKVKLFIDAEESWIQNVIDEMVLECMRKFNKKDGYIFNTYQFYLQKSYKTLQMHLELAQKEGFKIGAKLVRGAYLEKERKRATENKYLDPTNATKTLTDAEYNKSVALCIENIQNIEFCLGTHNEDSCQLCLSLMLKKGLEIGNQSIYFAQLLGMSDNISYNLAMAGANVAKYVPYGPIEAVMPYLFRRAEENTSIAGQSGREFLLIKKEIKRRNEE